MRNTRSFRVLCKDIQETYRLTHTTLRWIWHEIVTPYSRKKTSTAVFLMLFIMCIMMSTTYVLKEIIDALALGNSDTALLLLVFGVGGILVIAQILTALQNHTRELAWNDNYKSLYTEFSRLMFGRTMQELVSEESNVGAEQIESTKERVENIFYMILFESTQVLSTIIAVMCVAALVDTLVSGVFLILIVFNVLWFLYHNTLIEEKMDTLDSRFRKHNIRTVDKWSMLASIKSSGVEEKIVDQVRSEIEKPLKADRLVWAYWFARVDLIRALTNISIVIFLLAYGVHSERWSVGDFAAIFAWSMLLIEKFGFVGHFMRHLTHNVARIKAVREALSVPPAFNYNHGINYMRKD